MRSPRSVKYTFANAMREPIFWRSIAERYVGDRCEDAAVQRAARVRVLLLHVQPDDECRPGAGAVQRPDRLQERTGAEDWREAGRNVGVSHGTPVGQALA